MIKTEQLMVGDYVLHKDTPIKIAAIHKGKIGYHQRHDGLTWVRYDQIEPIPLAEEFLQKNFENPILNDYQIADCWRIWSNPNYGYICATLDIDDFGGGSYVPCVPCRYVHELQNFLRHLDINKPIEL